jgi:hypothetical protein
MVGWVPAAPPPILGWERQARPSPSIRSVTLRLPTVPSHGSIQVICSHRTSTSPRLVCYEASSPT